MAAFHSRYQPLFERVLAILASGELGPVRRLNAVFQVAIADTGEEIRHRPALGGGALMDLGTYCLHWCRTVMGAEPRVTAARALVGASGVDLATDASLAFPSGAPAATR